jgi:hypothetical protein
MALKGNEVFRHKTYGEIANVDWSFANGSLVIDGTKIDAEGAEYIIAYGIRQSLTDSYAAVGAKDDATLDDLRDAFRKRLARIAEGTIGVRERSAVSLETQAARDVTRAALFKMWGGGKSEKAVAFLASSKAEQRAKLDQTYAKNAAKLSEAYATRLAQLQAPKVDAIELDL